MPRAMTDLFCEDCRLTTSGRCNRHAQWTIPATQPTTTDPLGGARETLEAELRQAKSFAEKDRNGSLYGGYFDGKIAGLMCALDLLDAIRHRGRDPGATSMSGNCMCGFVRHCPVHGEEYADVHPPDSPAGVPNQRSAQRLENIAEQSPTLETKALAGESTPERGAAEAEAERLLAEITQGEWEVAPHSDTDEVLNVVAGYEKVEGGARANWIAECDAAIDFDSDREGVLEQNATNAEFIAAAPRLLRALLSQLAAAQAREQALRELEQTWRKQVQRFRNGAQEYGRHLPKSAETSHIIADARERDANELAAVLKEGQ